MYLSVLLNRGHGLSITDISNVIFSEMMVESVSWPRLYNTYRDAERHRSYLLGLWTVPTIAHVLAPKSPGLPSHIYMPCGSSTVGPRGRQHLVLPGAICAGKISANSDRPCRFTVVPSCPGLTWQGAKRHRAAHSLPVPSGISKGTGGLGGEEVKFMG